MADDLASLDYAAFLTEGGAVGALMREHDWSASPLGAPSTWPQSLRSVVGLLLSSKFPMVVAWGPELGFLYNDAYTAILGAKHPAALGQPFEEIWAEIWPDISPLIDAALAGQATFHEDMPLLMHRKGFDEQTWFTFSYSPVRDEAGQVAGMFCSAVETTDRVLAERRNASERERLARMFEQAPGFITILRGPEDVFDFANATYRCLFGDRDFVGRTARDVFPDLDGQGFFELLDQVYTTGERFVAQHNPVRLERAPGLPLEERVLDFIYEPLTDEAGRVTGIFYEGHDVTETQRAEAALRESKERLCAILETAYDYAIFTTDAEGRIDTWPKGAQEVFGWNSAEAVGQSVDMTFTPEDRAKGAPEIERMAAQAAGHSPNVASLIQAQAAARRTLASPGGGPISRSVGNPRYGSTYYSGRAQMQAGTRSAPPRLFSLSLGGAGRVLLGCDGFSYALLRHHERLVLIPRVDLQIGQFAAGDQKGALSLGRQMKRVASRDTPRQVCELQTLHEWSHAGTLLGRDGVRQQADDPASHGSGLTVLCHEGSCYRPCGCCAVRCEREAASTSSEGLRRECRHARPGLRRLTMTAHS